MEAPALATLAGADRALQAQADDTALALMRHRWEAINVHGYGVREYAAAVGRAHVTVIRYAKAWELYRAGGTESVPPADLLERVGHSEERAVALAAVAERHGVGMAAARQSHMPEVRRVQAVMAEAETLEDKRERAAQYVETVKRAEQAQRAETDRRRAQAGRQLLALETELDKSRRALRQAVLIARDANVIDDTWRSAIGGLLGDCDHLLRLLNAAIAGSSGVDWDAEMASLTGGQ